MRAARSAATKNIKADDSAADMDEWIAREKLQRRPSGLVAVSSPRSDEDDKPDPDADMFKVYFHGAAFLVRCAPACGCTVALFVVGDLTRHEVVSGWLCGSCPGWISKLYWFVAVVLHVQPSPLCGYGRARQKRLVYPTRVCDEEWHVFCTTLGRTIFWRP